MATRVTGDQYESITGQLFEIGRQLRQQNGYPFDPGKLQKHLQDAIEGHFKPTRKSFNITVDYDLELQRAIGAGHCDYVSGHITPENFPRTRTGTAELEVVLTDYGRLMDSEFVLYDLRDRGLRAAELPELLVIGEQLLIMGNEFVVGLSSKWRSPLGSVVPYIYIANGRRELNLRGFNAGWQSPCWFAAVRK